MTGRVRGPNQSHRAGVCGCQRCVHPLLKDLPPPRASGQEARRERLARILAEEQPWKREGPAT
jgi:hypothetical protein